MKKNKDLTFNQMELELIKESLSYFYILCIDNVTLKDHWIDKAMEERKSEISKELYNKICESQFYK